MYQIEEPKYFSKRLNEVEFATCSSDKARDLLNYKTSTSLSESIDKVINYIKSKGVKEFKYNYMLEIVNDKTPLTWKDRLF